jgi:hypothetical protein
MIMNSPEPMSLGSPTQSPTIQNSGQYLPQFLLGDLVPNQNVPILFSSLTLISFFYLFFSYLAKFTKWIESNEFEILVWSQFRKFTTS